MALDNEHTIIK